MCDGTSGNHPLTITVENLCQWQADDLIKSLSGTGPFEPLTNFREAFTAECEKGLSLRGALSDSKRLYYAVHTVGVRYLLVGITPDIDMDSIGLSFARICQEPRRLASQCLRVYMDTELIAYCKLKNKSLIKARIVNQHSKKVFDNLSKNVPPGFEIGSLTDTFCMFRVV